MKRALFVLIALTSIAHADDKETAMPAETVAKPAPAPVKKKRIYLRAGLAHLHPMTQSNELELADIDGPASLALHNGPIAGSGATVDPATIFAMIVGYQLTDKWSIETVLGLPFTVKFENTGTIKDMSLAPTVLGIPTGVEPLGAEMGEAKAAPPLLTAVYKLTDGAVQPFVGAGVAVLFTYGAHATNPKLTEISAPEFTVSPAPGIALQTGIDAKITKGVYARLDVKYIALMKANAEVHHIVVRTPDLPLFDTVEVGTAKLSMWVNPLIIQAGIGTDF